MLPRKKSTLNAGDVCHPCKTYYYYYYYYYYLQLVYVGRQSQWPFVSWDRGFESRRRYRCLSVVSVVCCQVGLCDGLITRPEKS
jgi:hypothetical protein